MGLSRMLSNLEVTRSAKTDDVMVVEGYALKFGVVTVLYRGKNFVWTEEIAKGALDETDLSDIVLNKNHDDKMLLARTLNGSLKLTIDDVGLRFRAEFVNTVLARDTFEEIISGLLSKMSFRWYGGAFTDSTDGDGNLHTTWTTIENMRDVSVVTFPAYSDTNIEVARSRVEKLDELEKIKKEKQRRDILAKYV